MIMTETIHTTADIKQEPFHTQIKKSDSFKLCATSLINKFSSSLSSKSEQRPRRHSSSSSNVPKKKSTGRDIDTEKNSIKRKASTLSITTSNIDIINKADKSTMNNLTGELEEQSISAKQQDLSENELQQWINSPSSDNILIPSPASTTKLSQLIQTMQSKHINNTSNSTTVTFRKKPADAKKLPSLITSPTNLPKSSQVVGNIDDAEKHYFQQKSISTPVSSCSKNPAKKYTQLTISTTQNNSSSSVYPSRYNWTNGKMEGVYNIQPLTPIKKVNSAEVALSNDNQQKIVGNGNTSSSSSSSSNTSSDDDDAIVTPFSVSCVSDPWISVDTSLKSTSSMRSATRKFMTRYKSSKSVDMTPRSPTQQLMMNQKFHFGSGPSYSTCDDFQLFNSSTLTKHNKSKSTDNLQRSTSTKSASSSESITSPPSSSSSSIFGKSEFRKKESKAIFMWYYTIQRLMQRSLLNQDNKNMTHVQKYTEKDQAIARFVISELYSTEKSFYQLLLFIRTNYMEPMYTASQSKNPLVKPNDVHTLFYCLLDFISTSEKLLFKLEEYAKDSSANNNMSPGLAIGQIFKDLEQDFVVFLKYAVHYQCHMKSIRRASHSGLILKIDRESKNSRENNRLGLADYLIAPFQRVPRYGLLIKDLLKHTPLPEELHFEGEAVINDLIYAQNVIDGLATAMDQVQVKISKSPFSTSFYSSFHSQSSTNLLTIQQMS